MRTAIDWKDYEIIDASGGEKLERFGDEIFIRPDPQIIWNTERNHKLWDSPHARYHRSEKGGGHWEFLKKTRENRIISYKGLKFNIRPTNFKHMGIFPEQAINWDFISQAIEDSERPVEVLNLFAYTGGATLAAVKAGASVCHVDASKGMIGWTKENLIASGLENGKVRLIVDDCQKFVSRETRRGNKYDIIIMDPPSYGRGPGGEVWKLEDRIYDLAKLCVGLLSEAPLLFLINSYTTGLSPSVMGYILNSVLKKYHGSIMADEIGLPVTESNCFLPCGSTACFVFL